MFLIQHVNGKILHCLVHFEGQRTIFWYRLIFVVSSLYGLNLYSKVLPVQVPGTTLKNTVLALRVITVMKQASD
jgi:hypothetical protein